jgi:uncharacterized Zn finger protein
MARFEFPPYVPVAQRRARIAREIAKRTKKGIAVEPVSIEGRLIAKTFWGKAWCDHLEGCSDFANRLPRGRTYVRNGSVLHLTVGTRRVEALVQGSELYKVSVEIASLPKPRWKAIVSACGGQITSLVELLQGKLSAGVMKIVTHPDKGLFPAPTQVEMRCSCPDSATMCKHVAAVLYGVGARLDTKPDLLFLLRGVDHSELIDSAASATVTSAATGTARRLANDELSSVFGIELDTGPKRSRRR